MSQNQWMGLYFKNFANSFKGTQNSTFYISNTSKCLFQQLNRRFVIPFAIYKYLYQIVSMPHVVFHKSNAIQRPDKAKLEMTIHSWPLLYFNVYSLFSQYLYLKYKLIPTMDEHCGNRLLKCPI